MKNPLRKRLPRELRDDIGKYIALFLFLTAIIGFVSGFLVADGSMKTAYDNSFSKYHVEDGHFTLLHAAKESDLEKLEDEQNVTIYSLWYKDRELGDGSTIRIYPVREEVNQICLMEGRMPQQTGEIVIDRLYAENNGIALGDSLSVGSTTLKITGFAAFSDYSALFKNNTDMMFDANRFTVSAVTQDTFDELNDVGLQYTYAWTNNESDLTEQERHDKEEEMLKAAAETVLLTDFVPQSSNQAIQFTGEDMGSDKSMMTVLLYLVMALLAFSFAVTTKSSIEQESSAIGTLRASGYTRGELLRHYMTLPMLVTLTAALLGNLIGYTGMKQIVVTMYYHSYSLPTYVTLWNAEAFIKTTLIPVLLVFAVNAAILFRALSLPPIQFLRHELRKKKKKRVMRLPLLRIFPRIRLRIILQNAAAYSILALGICLANVLLMFGMCMGPLVAHFKDDVLDTQFAAYQYILKGTDSDAEDEYTLSAMFSPFLPVLRQSADILEIEDASYLLGFSTDTEEESAEKYSVQTLQLPDGGEEITVYGVQPDSRYLTDLNLPEESDEVIVSDSYMEKYRLKIGDTIQLEQKYEDNSYTFRVAGSYPYAAALAVFLPQDAYRDVFDRAEDSFSGYFSDCKLTDLEDLAIASVITQDDLTVLADQLTDSMGGMMPLVDGIALLLYVLVLYLLTKMIVERNAQAISMLKILGYEDGEIGRLYSTATAIVAMLSLGLSLPLCTIFFKKVLIFYMMQEMNGWIRFYIAPTTYLKMLLYGAVCYGIIHFLQMRKIRKVPFTQALKHIE
jgi:putative ABC transport system permease protein